MCAYRRRVRKIGMKVGGVGIDACVAGNGNSLFGLRLNEEFTQKSTSACTSRGLKKAKREKSCGSTCYKIMMLEK